MELVEGQDLSVRITRRPMAAADAVTIARQTADALETAHERGVVHRDLKPSKRHRSHVVLFDSGTKNSVRTAPESLWPLTSFFWRFQNIESELAGGIHAGLASGWASRRRVVGGWV
jgi:serine/threonine protein kinase